MIKRCGKCGRVASSTLDIRIEGNEEITPLLCRRCKSNVISEIRNILAKIRSKEVKVVKSLSYEQRD